jgi:hypothetical protein
MDDRCAQTKDDAKIDGRWKRNITTDEGRPLWMSSRRFGCKGRRWGRKNGVWDVQVTMLRKQQAHKETPQIQDLSLQYMPKISNAQPVLLSCQRFTGLGGKPQTKRPEKASRCPFVNG